MTRRSALASFVGVGAGLASVLRPGSGLAQGTAPSQPPGAGWPAPRVNGFIRLGDGSTYYEEQGQGIPVVLCSGASHGAEATRPTAEKLGSKYRVLAWDRFNRGRSDFVFKGSKDVDLWADQLVELLGRLNATPAYLVGASSGTRTAFTAAVRYPDAVRGLFMFLPGGNNLWPGLPHSNWGQYADLAEKGGMQAVAMSPFWAGLIQRNPANRNRLLEMDPQEFIRVMRRWTAAFKQSDVVIEMTEADLRRHNANGIPTCIIAGCAQDNAHLRAPTERMAELMPNAEFLDPPGFCDEWMKKLQTRYFEMSSIPALVDAFITRTAAKAKT